MPYGCDIFKPADIKLHPHQYNCIFVVVLLVFVVILWPLAVVLHAFVVILCLFVVVLHLSVVIMWLLPLLWISSWSFCVSWWCSDHFVSLCSHLIAFPKRNTNSHFKQSSVIHPCVHFYISALGLYAILFFNFYYDKSPAQGYLITCCSLWFTHTFTFRVSWRLREYRAEGELIVIYLQFCQNPAFVLHIVCAMEKLEFYFKESIVKKNIL